MYLKDKNIFVVGGSSGIGAEFVKSIVKNNNVGVVARREEKIYQKAHFINKCDVSNENDLKSSVKEFCEAFGKIDIFIYCAGIQQIKPLRVVSDDDLKSIMDINLIGAFRLAKLFLSKKFTNEDSVFGAISSIAAIKPEKAILPYSASKAGLENLIRGLAVEASPKRTFGISPGWVKTEMTENFSKIYTDEFIEELNEKTPVGITSLKSLVDALQFLSSEKAKHITGQTLIIDGGITVT